MLLEGLFIKDLVLRPLNKNGMVERKHLLILNVDRALICQTKLPKSFWSYVVLHVVFLINRAYTPLLNHKSSFQHLYDSIPNINLFKVFGSLCQGRP